MTSCEFRFIEIRDLKPLCLLNSISISTGTHVINNRCTRTVFYLYPEICTLTLPSGLHLHHVSTNAEVDAEREGEERRIGKEKAV